MRRSCPARLTKARSVTHTEACELLLDADAGFALGSAVSSVLRGVSMTVQSGCPMGAGGACSALPVPPPRVRCCRPPGALARPGTTFLRSTPRCGRTGSAVVRSGAVRRGQAEDRGRVEGARRAGRDHGRRRRPRGRAAGAILIQGRTATTCPTRPA